MQWLQTLVIFLNGENANNKVNRLGLEPAAYSITFEWISGAQNKAANCLSRLVDLPQDRQDTIQMLSNTIHDGPTFHTRSRAAQLNIPKNSTLQPRADTVTPDITKITDTPATTPKPITEDRLQILLQMQKTDPFCKHIFKYLSNRKSPKHEVDLFLHIKGLLYTHITDSNQKFFALVIPKLGNTQYSWKHMLNLVTREPLKHTAS